MKYKDIPFVYLQWINKYSLGSNYKSLWLFWYIHFAMHPYNLERKEYYYFHLFETKNISVDIDGVPRRG